MSGYAASARLQGGSLRFVAAGSGQSGAMGASGRPDDRAAVPVEPLDGARVEPIRSPRADRLADRLDDLRLTWSQTTFYLFDPDSWR